MTEQEFADLAAGHALNALSPDDEQIFEAALAEHPEWAVHVAADVDTVARLADGITPVEPPRSLRRSLLAQIAESTPDAAPPGPSADLDEDYAAAGPAPTVVSDPVPEDASPVAPVSPRGRSWGPRSWFTLAASFVVLLALGFGAVTISQQLTRPAAVVALEQIEGQADAQTATVELSDGGTATAHWSADAAQVVLVSDGLPALPSDQTFELWFVRGAEPISAGTFSAEDGDATALLSGEFEPGDVIAVTVEPAGGSPTGAPSSTPIVAIPTA